VYERCEVWKSGSEFCGGGNEREVFGSAVVNPGDIVNVPTIRLDDGWFGE
jgi:hypothetical protein